MPAAKCLGSRAGKNNRGDPILPKTNDRNHAHDPLVCGLDRATDCARCRRTDDTYLVGREEALFQEKAERAFLAKLGPPEIVRGALMGLLADGIGEIAAAVAREVRQ